MLPMRTVGVEFFESAPTVVRVDQAIGAPPQVVWDSLTGREDWRDWLGLSVHYLTEAPHGLGTERTVTPFPAPSALRNHERFFVWEEPHRFAFHFTRAPLPVTAFAEDYVLEHTPGDRTLLRWTGAVDGPLPTRLLLGAALRRMFTTGLPKLARMLEARVLA